jgi:hypothetical protein
MTLETPLHLQRRGLISDWHLVDSSVAGGTTHTFVYVNAVIEVGVVRKIVNSNPLDGFSGAKTGSNWFQIRTISPDLLVTIHARSSRRHSCRSRSLYGCVAVPTIDAIVSEVMLVTELNRLLPLNPLTGVP